MQIGFGGLSTIVFIVLRLMGTNTWSWLWVLSPLLISFVLWAVLVLAVVARASRIRNASRKAR